jgi:hypothetical protein
VTPTSNLTAYPISLPTKKAKALNVIISSEMELPSFAKEYENITSCLDAIFDKDRLFAKLEVAVFSRTGDC